MKILEESIRIKVENLIKAGEEAFELLLEQVKKPIDEELADDKARNAMKAKKECFMDAKEILSEVNLLKNKLEGRDEDEEEESDAPFKGSYAEEFAKKKDK